MKTLVLAVLCAAFSLTSSAQLHPLNEVGADLLGHAMGFGITYRRTLDVTHMHHWHGFISTGVTNGMLSNYVGFGYRHGTDWFIEFEGLAGYNSLYGIRRRKDDPNEIRSGLSYGGHVNLGRITIDNYSARVTIGYHHFQANYGQFILGMQVGMFFD